MCMGSHYPTEELVHIQQILNPCDNVEIIFQNVLVRKGAGYSSLKHNKIKLNKLRDSKENDSKVHIFIKKIYNIVRH